MDVLIGGVSQPVKITRKWMKNINLRVSKDGAIQISCPNFASELEIKRLIYMNEAWILEQQLKRKQENEINREGVNGPVLYWLGEKKYVRYLPAKRDSLTVDGDILTFYLKEETDDRIEQTFRKAAAREILRLAEERRGAWDALICSAHGLPLPEITMRYMTSRWGVCYPRKAKITLSTRLIHYPIECMEYVLLHEYAHFLVQNHSPAFYAVIAQYMPDYKERRKRLK